MRRLSFWLLLGAGALVFVGCGGAQQRPQEAQPTIESTAAPGVAPAVSINDLMVDWVDHAAHALWNVEEEGQVPKDEKAWREIERHSTQLAAAGTLIALGGTGQADQGWARQPAWKMYSQQLTGIGLDAFKAARNRNLADLTAINSRLVSTCLACHKEFKPDSPTEGRVHDPE